MYFARCYPSPLNCSDVPVQASFLGSKFIGKRWIWKAGFRHYSDGESRHDGGGLVKIVWMAKFQRANSDFSPKDVGSYFAKYEQNTPPLLASAHKHSCPRSVHECAHLLCHVPSTGSCS